MKNFRRLSACSIDLFLAPSTQWISWSLFAAFVAANLWWLVAHDLRSVDVVPPLEAELTIAEMAHQFCRYLTSRNRSCDHTRGKWVYSSASPLYTNETCGHIYFNQNCVGNGRPDRDYLYWKWRPNDCEIPSFDSALFLELMRERKLLFVGDSMARNHMLSLLCTLSQVESPEDLQDRDGVDAAWLFPSYNFTLSLVWSPLLVNYTQEEGGSWIFHTDKPDSKWTQVLSSYDVTIFSAAYWFFRPTIYYVNDKPFLPFDPSNFTSHAFLQGMHLVWETVMTHLVNHYRGVALLRSVSVSHFEGSPWDKGGTCNRTQPYADLDGDMEIPWMQNEVLKVQRNEVTKAVVLKGNASLPILKLLDVTYSSLLRPDGHPGPYRVQTSDEPKNDCLHWCMPGPVDMWNQLMLSDPDIMCNHRTKG